MRVMHAFGEPLSSGGQESFVMNMYHCMDRKKVQFDFCTPFECTNSELQKEIRSMGGRVFSGDGKFYSRMRKITLVKYYHKFLKTHRIEIIHIHSGSIFNLAIVAHIARKNGVKRIIVHSHATGKNDIKHKLSRVICSKTFTKNVTDFFACSEDAARWKFPKKIINNKQYTIINNGINTKLFAYNKEKRKVLRKQFGIPEDSLVLVHVGRFTEEKNHSFIIDVFEKTLSIKKNSFLVLVGDGILRQEIEKKVKEKRIDKMVLFLGNQKDIPGILSMSDVFIFPSKFEGLGISVIEAECSGLPVYCSATLPHELDITENVCRLSISDNAEEWAKNIHEEYYSKGRVNNYKIVRDHGFDCVDSAFKLMNSYHKERR